MKLLCKHKWEVLSDLYTKSPIERAVSIGLEEFKGAGSDFYLATHETIVTCPKCGKIKRYVERV